MGELLDSCKGLRMVHASSQACYSRPDALVCMAWAQLDIIRNKAMGVDNRWGFKVICPEKEPDLWSPGGARWGALLYAMGIAATAR